MKYDSKGATLEHISHVRTYLFRILSLIQLRAADHDQSMLQPTEKEQLDEIVPLLAETEAGSQENKDLLDRLRPALDSHHKANSHHIEHYGNLNGMDLVDLIEWLCDQKAASHKDKNPDVYKRLLYYYQKYDFPPQLMDMINNTVKRYFGNAKE
jgi:hypothetical protein